MHHSTYNAAFSGIIGIAREDITPPAGIYAGNWGAARFDTAKGIHRPLMLTCSTFADNADTAGDDAYIAGNNAKPLVLIAADLGWWKSSADEQILRKRILKEVQLDESRLMICLSHTHAGPSLFTEDIAKPGGRFIAPYLEFIGEKAVAAIRKALSTASPCTLSWDYGKCNLAANRDLPEESSERLLVGFNPGQPADDTLLVGRLTNKAGEITGTIVNYACHPTTLAWDNELISPDFIGSMRELVESYTGSPCLFLQGASGELAPREQYSGDCSLADRYGRQLGHAVLSALEGMFSADAQLIFSRTVESGAPLAVWKEKIRQPSTILRVEMIAVELALKPLPSLNEIEKQLLTCADPVQKERLWRLRGVRKTVGEGSVTPMPMWIWRLGDACLVGQPNEAYSCFQQELRRELAPKPVAVMNIVNGHAGYLPPRHLYDQNIYSVWQTPFSPGGLEHLTETAVAAAAEIMK